MKKFFPLFLALLFACTALLAQEAPVVQTLDEEMEDAVYIAEYQLDTTDFSETFYLYNAMTGVPEGKMVYKNGNYYMDRNGVLTKLTRSDLLQMFDSEQFRDYKKAKGQWNASIPLFVIGGCAGALAVAGAGLWIYNWIQITRGIYHGDTGKFSTTPAFTGFLCVIAGMAVGAATLIPAINLNHRGSSMMGSLAYDYNYSRDYEENRQNNLNPGKRPASNSSMRISIGGNSQGLGLALHF